jgi:hypothetical protein
MRDAKEHDSDRQAIYGWLAMWSPSRIIQRAVPTVLVWTCTAFACGSSDATGPSPNGYACAKADPASKTPSCMECLKARCDSDLSDAYGAGWSSGHIDGECPSSFEACVKRCTCDDSSCSSSCLSAAGSNCQSAALLAGTCAAALCGNVCQ